MTMMVEDFCNYLKLERNYSERTIQSYREDLTLFETFFSSIDPSLDFLSIDRDIVRDWVAGMMEGGGSPSTVNRRLSALRSFYRYLRGRGITETSPVSGVKGPKGRKPLPQFVRESEMDELLDSTDLGKGLKGVRDRAIIATFYETGVRLAELIGLDCKDIEFDNRTIKVTGKRNKQRIIPFGDDLSQILSDYLVERQKNSPSCAAFFISDCGERISRSYVYRLVHDSLSKVSSVGKKSPHVLRHTFATSMLNHDAELGVVKELLGHDSLATTEIYTHTTSEELKRIYKQAHPRV